MKKRTKILIICAVVITAMVVFSVPVFALTEAEVRQRVAEVGREEVSGNIFIWFLCAIAFMKIAQKMSSFVSSLGISVGNTGGSMLGEALVVARGLSIGAKFLGGGFGGKGGGGGGGGSGGGTKFLSGGLAGAVSRKFNNSAVSVATEQGGNIFARSAFQSSLSKGGSFANNIVSTVAKGSINQTGVISGDTASKAMLSYMGYAGNDTVIAQSHSQLNTGDGNTPGTENYTGSSNTPFGPNPENAGQSSIPFSSTDTENIVQNTVPTYKDVEIGGGRMMGMEVSAANPEGIQFGMYNTEQYIAPEKGAYDTVTTVDGAQWYRQYAADVVEKTPYTRDDGKVGYNESIVQKLPPIPRRKDKV